MELLLSGPSNSCYSVIASVPPSAMASCSFSPSLSLHSQRINSPRLSSKSAPLSYFNNTGLRSSSLVAGSSNNSAAVTNQESKFGGKSNPQANGDVTEELDDSKLARVCDKLIDVFMVDKPTPADWRRLIVFSKSWDDLRPHFYKRCQEKAENEDDSDRQFKILRFARKLKEVDQDIQRHNELLDAVRNSESGVVDIVSRRRKDFTREFFDHFHTVAESYYDDPEEQKAVEKLIDTCIAAVRTYDAASENIEAMNAAELKLQDILNSPSVDAAYRKIDSLAEKNQLDSALALTATKAWSDAKETNLVKDEAKDILYHLYMTSRGNLERLIPKEIRILKYLLTIKDPEERMSALNDAFTPGEETEGDEIDMLYTTPEQLHTSIRTLVNAYHSSTEGTVLRQARDLMKPKTIKKMEELEKTIRDNFM